METNQENHAIKTAMNWEHARDEMNKQYLQAYDKAVTGGKEADVGSPWAILGPHICLQRDQCDLR
jgi:hypothetical protein